MMLTDYHPARMPELSNLRLGEAFFNHTLDDCIIQGFGALLVGVVRELAFWLVDQTPVSQEAEQHIGGKRACQNQSGMVAADGSHQADKKNQTANCGVGDDKTFQNSHKRLTSSAGTAYAWRVSYTSFKVVFISAFWLGMVVSGTRQGSLMLGQIGSRLGLYFRIVVDQPEWLARERFC